MQSMLPPTFALFVVLTGALIALRLSWSRISLGSHRILIACACAALFIYAFTFVTGWSTSSNHLNASLYWFAIAGYELFLFLFTLLRPRWLTIIIAIVLIIPILSASPFLPLTELFNSAPHSIAPIGPDLVSDRSPWSDGPFANSGFDLVVYSYPSWTHFVRRRRQGARYYNGQCDAAHASATLQPDQKHVLMSCPAAPGQPQSSARNLVVKLY